MRKFQTPVFGDFEFAPFYPMLRFFELLENLCAIWQMFCWFVLAHTDIPLHVDMLCTDSIIAQLDLSGSR